MTDSNISTKRSWAINASKSTTGWHPQVNVSVFAENVLEAVEKFKQVYPDHTIWSIRHEGQRIVVS